MYDMCYVLDNVRNLRFRHAGWQLNDRLFRNNFQTSCILAVLMMITEWQTSGAEQKSLSYGSRFISTNENAPLSV